MGEFKHTKSEWRAFPGDNPSKLFYFKFRAKKLITIELTGVGLEGAKRCVRERERGRESERKRESERERER